MKKIDQSLLFFLLFIGILQINAQTYPSNPDVVVATFAGGPLSAPYVANTPVVISDPYNSRVYVFPTVVPTHDKIWATAGQIGSVYGIAYSPSTRKAYASAYVKRHTQLGAGNGGNPSGLGSAGAIYTLSPPASGGGPSTVTVLVDIGAAAGTTVRTPSSDWTCDPAIYEVGRVGWGDIDVSLDGSILWAMNLYNKSLYKINATSGAILGTYPIPGVTGGLPFDAPITTNENLDLRPFGLKVTDTKVYVGVISSGESLYPSGGLDDPCNSPNGTPALRGYVFSFDISGSTFSNTPVLDFPFQGASWNNGLCDSYGTGDKWMYWMPLANMQAGYAGYAIQQRSPAIADIEIDAAGSFLIGLRNITNDRLSTIPGLFFPDCINGSNSGGFGGFGGQLLKACGGPSSWTIESNGSCGGSSGFNNQVFFDYQTPHSNGNYGGSIAYKTGSGEILSPASSGGDQGSMYFIQEATKAPSGTYNVLYSLLAFPNDPNANPLFGKANGLGDVDLQSNLSCPTVTNPGSCNNNILVNSTLENGNFTPTTGTFVGSPYKLISNTDAVLNNWWVNKGYWIDALNAGGGPDGSCKIVWIDPSYGNSICIYPVPDVNLTANQCYTMSVWAAPFDPNNPTAAQTMSFDLVTNSSSEQFIVIDNNGGGTVNTFDDGPYGVVSTTINLSGNTAPKDINGNPFTNSATQTLDWSTLNWQLVTIKFHVTQNMPLSVNYSINDATSNGVVFDNPVFGECCASSCVVSLTATPSTCNPANNQYSVTGSITFSNPPSSGTLTVSVGTVTQTFNAPFTSPQAYTLSGLTSDGASHTVTVTFSADATCTSSANYTAPTSCSTCTPSCMLTTSYLGNTILAFNGSTYNLEGTSNNTGCGISGTYDMDLGPDGNLYVVSSLTNQVFKYSPTGDCLGVFINSGNGLSDPRGIEFLSDGTLLVTAFDNNGSNGKILRYNATTGAFIGVFSTGSDITTGTAAIGPHIGVELGPDGAIWVADYKYDRVLRFNATTGAYLSTFAQFGGTDGTRDIMFGQDGYLYISFRDISTVKRYNYSTGAFVDVFANSAQNLYLTSGMTWGPDGLIYIGNVGSLSGFPDGNITVMNPTTNALVTNIATNTPKRVLFQCGKCFAPNCVVSLTATPGTCNPNNNQYTLTGDLTFSNPPSSGTLTVSVGAITQTFNAPFTSPQNYSISGLIADGASHTVTTSFSADAICTNSTTFTAPNNCTPLPCTVSLTATPGVCNSSTNQYTLTGQVTFTNPPSTGTLTVQITGGGSQVFNAPFTSPQSYSIAGQISDGASHIVTAVFSADAACTNSMTYTAPSNCTPNTCSVSLTATPGTCNPANNQYSVTGSITFSNPPSSGTLTVSVSGGGSQVLNAPFTSPLSYSIPGLTSDGISHTVTATFSADANCTNSTTFTAPAACGCNNTPIPLCPGESYTMTAQSGYQNYQWYTVSGTTETPIAGATSQTYTVTATGIYKWKATDGNSCPVEACCQYEFQAINCATCNVAITASPGSCVPATNQYTLNGQVTFSTPPTTGNLIVKVGVDSIIVALPQTSPYVYALPNLTADGASHQVIAYFSAEPTCTNSAVYTAPANCTPLCSATITASPGSCVPATIRYTLNGQVTFSTPPSSGNLIVKVGTDSIIVALPITSPYVYSIPNLPADGAAHSVITYFSAEPMCTNSAVYTAPLPCPAPVPPCAIVANVVVNGCNSNGTLDNATDDYFTITVSATATNPGGANKYVVAYGTINPLTGAGGNVMNPGGTTYGTAVVLGTTGQLNADGTTTFDLSIRDSQKRRCFQKVTVGPVEPCSPQAPPPGCEPSLCVPVQVIKN